MSLDWLKSISAKVGIEGRNVTIVAALVFCGFGLWIFNQSYASHWQLSIAFLCAFFALAATVVLVGLLAKPQPSEVTQRYFVRQIGNQQFIFVSGMQSQEELAALLRAAHNVQELPPPTGLVKGSAADENNYQDLSPMEAAGIATGDNEEVQKKLIAEASRLLSSFAPQRLAAQAMCELKTTEIPALETEKSKK